MERDSLMRRTNSAADSIKDWQSIALPIILILTGAVLLAGDFWGVLSLDQIQRFWPAAVIIVGIIELLAWHDANVEMESHALPGRGREHDRDVSEVR
jgi:hypothetical protein